MNNSFIKESLDRIRLKKFDDTSDEYNSLKLKKFLSFFDEYTDDVYFLELHNYFQTYQGKMNASFYEKGLTFIKDTLFKRVLHNQDNSISIKLLPTYFSEYKATQQNHIMEKLKTTTSSDDYYQFSLNHKAIFVSPFTLALSDLALKNPDTNKIYALISEKYPFTLKEIAKVRDNILTKLHVDISLDIITKIQNIYKHEFDKDTTVPLNFFYNNAGLASPSIFKNYFESCFLKVGSDKFDNELIRKANIFYEDYLILEEDEEGNISSYELDKNLSKDCLYAFMIQNILFYSDADTNEKTFTNSIHNLNYIFSQDIDLSNQIKKKFKPSSLIHPFSSLFEDIQKGHKFNIVDYCEDVPYSWSFQNHGNEITLEEFEKSVNSMISKINLENILTQKIDLNPKVKRKI